MTYLSAITIFHTAVSLLAILVGVLAMAQLLRPGTAPWSVSWFFWTAVVTSATGFLFPLQSVTPAVIVGIVALLVLLAVFVAAQRSDRSALARHVYAAGLVASLYLLVFVGIVQAFQKVGVLNRFAPTGTELPFAATQLVTLLLFIGLGIVAARSNRSALRLA